MANDDKKIARREKRAEKKIARREKRAEKKLTQAERAAPAKALKLKKKFGFDIEGFKASGGDVSQPRLSSRDPRTGEIFKGRRHPTISRTRAGEKQLGMKVFRTKGGTLFSLPKGDVAGRKAVKRAMRETSKK